ncbi:hypothetical protein N7523_001092 [Penicillium sp. IBT 18751x]|nr:hypothetical protein N7523_001092 [Penicillium sp. IBT 18751x]
MSRYTVWTRRSGKDRTVPSVVMQLMIRNGKEVVVNDMSSGSRLKSKIVQFLNAVKGESSPVVLKEVGDIYDQILGASWCWEWRTQSSTLPLMSPAWAVAASLAARSYSVSWTYSAGIRVFVD